MSPSAGKVCLRYEVHYSDAHHPFFHVPGHATRVRAEMAFRSTWHLIKKAGESIDGREQLAEKSVQKPIGARRRDQPRVLGDEAAPTSVRRASWCLASGHSRS